MLFRHITFLALLLCPMATGCGRSLPPAADGSKARQARVTALDAWRDGGSVQSLRSASPAIYFNEPQFNASRRLVDYRIESEHAYGQSWGCEGTLTLQSDQGQKAQRLTGYYIEIGDAIVMAPQT